MPATGVNVVVCQHDTRLVPSSSQVVVADTALPEHSGQLKATAFCTLHCDISEGQSCTWPILLVSPSSLAWAKVTASGSPGPPTRIASHGEPPQFQGLAPPF